MTRLRSVVHVVTRPRMVRFGLVGISGVVVNSAILLALAEGIGLTPVVASALATEGAILTNFAINDRWTFGDAPRERSWAARAVRYNIVAMGGLAITVCVLAALLGMTSLHYLVANLLAIAAATAWNYTVNGAMTWSVWGGGLMARASAARVAGLRLLTGLFGGG
jgi:dolichol-phosphate mannosyltransferase